MMQMANCSKCDRPTPLEELASDEMCTSCCQKAYGLTGVDADWDAEAEKLFQRLNLTEEENTGRHNDVDAVWKHPTTGAAVYIGNRRAAMMRKILNRHGIRAVVNCQGMDSQNFFEGKGIKYYRMDVQSWPTVLKEDDNEKGEGVVDYFAPCFEWVDSSLEQGDSVLIHCYAGAHRAGTVGTAYLMHAARIRLVDALRLAQHCRPIVNPFAKLLKLLHMLDTALEHERAGETTPRKPFDERKYKPAYILRQSAEEGALGTAEMFAAATEKAAAEKAAGEGDGASEAPATSHDGKDAAGAQASSPPAKALEWWETLLMQVGVDPRCLGSLGASVLRQAGAART